MSSDGVKTLRALIRRAPGEGWEVEDRGHRYVWKGPEGQYVATPKTPDGTISTRKTVALLKRHGFPVEKSSRKKKRDR
jgi:hypothetical protein